MTRCTWPTAGRRDRAECGHRAHAGWLLDGEVLPRCSKHVSREALRRASDEGVELVDLDSVGVMAGRHR